MRQLGPAWSGSVRPKKDSVRRARRKPYSSGVRWLLVGLAWCASPAAAGAQAWDTPAVTAVLDRAAERRATNDSTLRSWSAEATGTLQFLADLGELSLGPRVVKVEQLATLLRWRQPGRAEQRIVGRRDTLMLPADAGFYRDRYGVITNNLGDRVVLGEGNDVRDLPHPLSPAGRARHSFALVDSLALSLPNGRRVEVYELLVRPRTPDAPAMVGSLYVAKDAGDLVRLAVTFTRAAILDARIERLSLVLENLLVEGRYWLPFRQQLEVVRKSPWIDFPARGIVRGRWDVCCHDVIADTATRELPPLPAGGQVMLATPGTTVRLAPADELARHEWSAPLGASLDEGATLVSEAEAREVQARAEALVRQRALDRTTSGLSGRSLSEFARFNRVEGPGVGAGARLAIAPAWTIGGSVGYGFSDEQLKVSADVRWRPRAALALKAFGARRYREAGDIAETSGVRNSLGALLFGDDNTDFHDARGGGLAAEIDLGTRTRLALAASYEEQRPVEVHASPIGGTFGPTIPALELNGARFEAVLTRGHGAGPVGGSWAWRVALRTGYVNPTEGADGGYGRVAGALEWQRAIGSPTLVLGTALGAVAGGVVPTQDLVRFGGITTGPGYSFHAFAGEYALSQRAELRVPVPFPSITLSRYGRTPPHMTLAPYAHMVCVAERSGGDDGCYPSLGVGATFLFDLLRFDLAYGLREEGGWRFGVDVGRVLWGVL
jgi:hypothetical protein